jgi:hypothetical protein
MPIGKDRTSQYDVGVGGGGFAPSDTGGRSSDFARALALRLNQYKEMGRDAYKKLTRKMLASKIPPKGKTDAEVRKYNRDMKLWEKEARKHLKAGGDPRDLYE